MFRKLSIFVMLMIGMVAWGLIDDVLVNPRPRYEQFKAWTDLVITSELDGVTALSEAQLDERERAYHFINTRCPNLTKELRKSNRSLAKCMMGQMMDAMDFGYFDQNQTFTAQETRQEVSP